MSIVQEEKQGHLMIQESRGHKHLMMHGNEGLSNARFEKVKKTPLESDFKISELQNQ